MYRIQTDENEKPLDRWLEAGGYGSLLRTIAVVGDSLASGEFESLAAEGEQRGYHDMYEYSWGQFMARALGNKVYNFSRGGMTAKWYLESYADEKGLWNRDLVSQAYIFALGVNDVLNQKQPIGTVEDIRPDWHDNAETFAGYLGAVVQRYREIQPDAKLFFMTMPHDTAQDEQLLKQHRRLMYDFAAFFPNAYVLDIYQYGPLYDEEFKKTYFMGGHMNPLGYLFTAQMVISYLDYIVRHHSNDFKLVPFIGTPFTNITVK